MSSPLPTLLALAAFILVFGGITLWICWRVLRGLAIQWRQRGRAQRLAAAEGWRYAGHDQFAGRMGDRDWRGGPHEDDDDGQRWTDFEGGVPGVSPGGFVVVSRVSWKRSRAKWRQRQGRPEPDNLLFKAEAAFEKGLHQIFGGAFAPAPEHPDDDRIHWLPQDVGSPSFSERWVLLASHACWAAVWTPAIERLWLQAHDLHPGDIHAHAQHHFLSLKRDDARIEPTLEQVAALLRLGQALMATTLAAARPDWPRVADSGGPWRDPAQGNLQSDPPWPIA